MKKLHTLLLIARFFSFSVALAQTGPEIEWQNTIGGDSYDYLRSAIQTADGGYLLAGFSLSSISGDKTEENIGQYYYSDYWVVKLDASSNIEWQNTIGGNSADWLYSVIQTNDGGYLLGGSSESGISADKTEESQGYFDYWVVKLNSSGNIEWQNSIGGSSNDDLYSVIETIDGGYLLGGSSTSGISGDKSEANQGASDYWVVKLNYLGNIEWQNSIGGDAYDELNSIIQTIDGGYLLGGWSNSNISGDKTEASQKYSNDFWVCKLEGSGNLEWQNTIGDGSNEYLYSIIQANDGGYLLGGSSFSTFSNYEYWVVKLDGSGNFEWQNTIGGDSKDFLYSIIQTEDGGYLLGGTSESSISGDKTEGTAGGYDYWVLKLDDSGNIEWQNTIGGYYEDQLFSVIQTTDGGYLLGGYSSSNISGDKTEASQGVTDYWVVKLLPEVINQCVSPTSLSTVNVAPTSAKLTWDAVPDAIGYQIRYKSPGTSQWITTHSTNNQKTLTGLTPNTKYIWKVKAVCSKSPLIESDSFAQAKFMTPLLKSEDEMVSTQHLFAEVYPNPVQNELTISMAIPAGEVTIRFYDLQGKMIDLPTTIQNTQAQINTTALPYGFYTLQITDNKTGISEVRKFVKQR
jgi:hypothetical protein